ncbi:MAG: hypothetical protein Q4A60_06500 [Pasteurellaceae bacterium]|nr:hypothetical protein [Pasteurellaceae bacterium]
MIEVHGWQAITYFVGLVMTILGMLIGFGKILLAQFESKLDLRFKSNDENYRRLHDDIKAAKEMSEASEKLALELKIALPNDYQRREDAIRSEAVNSARLDAINTKLDQIILMNGKQ